ncbi:hypothetical protein EYZ11_009576 [Aspergillus tanneri]|nr:hypothetical protein EYZ11_009576 [Aspergillus tanneri]
MFDLPSAKRVRREQLLSRDSSSPSPSPPPESALSEAHQRLGELLNLDTFVAPVDLTPSQPDQDEEEEQEFEFRLFSAPAKTQKHDASQAQTQATSSKGTNGDQTHVTQKLRIRLRSPTPGVGGIEDGGFVNPFRGWGYYFSTPTLFGTGGNEDPQLAVKRKQFADVAVSGHDMLTRATVSWPGCHLPWRVVRLKRQHTKLPRGSEDTTIVASNVESQDRSPKSRTKPGKKRRLQLRKRVKAAEQANETEAEKRNRKNRERKIKRRQKAREMKAAAAAGQAPDVSSVGLAEDVPSQNGGN